MSWNSTGDHERNHGEAVDWEVASALTSAPVRTVLGDEVEALQQQIALLEEALTWAPGMERAALFKELAEYRRELDTRRHTLRQDRGTGGARQGTQ